MSNEAISLIDNTLDALLFDLILVRLLLAVSCEPSKRFKLRELGVSGLTTQSSVALNSIEIGLLG